MRQKLYIRSFKSQMQNPGFRITIHNPWGFTLLELMISITLVGFLTVIIAGALRAGLDAVERAERMAESLERVRTSINIISSQIQSQIPLTYEKDGERRYYFEGNSSSLQISTGYSIWNGQSICVVRYEVVSDEEEKKTLKVYEYVIKPTDETKSGETMETELFRGADEIAFEYFYKGPTDEHGEWVEEWPEEAGLPEKMKFSLSYEGTVFSMIIPVRTTGNVTNLNAPDNPEWGRL